MTNAGAATSLSMMKFPFAENGKHLNENGKTKSKTVFFCGQ